MNQILVMMVAVVLVGCSNETPETSQAAEAEPQVAPEPSLEPDPVPPSEEKIVSISDPIVEKAIRRELNTGFGEFTKADLEKVTELELYSSGITDEGLKEVAKLENLKHLSSGLTQITDEGLKEIAKLQRLTELFMENTKVTKEGVAELKKALPNCNIEGL